MPLNLAPSIKCGTKNKKLKNQKKLSENEKCQKGLWIQKNLRFLVFLNYFDKTQFVHNFSYIWLFVEWKPDLLTEIQSELSFFLTILFGNFIFWYFIFFSSFHIPPFELISFFFFSTLLSTTCWHTLNKVISNVSIPFTITDYCFTSTYHYRMKMGQLKSGKE